jgi:hypothetical protein
MTNIENIGSLVEQFGDDMDKAAWQQISAKRDEIVAIIAQHFSYDASGKFLGVYSVEQLYNKLRQLSNIA